MLHFFFLEIFFFFFFFCLGINGYDMDAFSDEKAVHSIVNNTLKTCMYVVFIA